MIRILPTQPRWRYRYTCPRCGSHSVSHVPASGGWHAPYLRICTFCRWVYRKRGKVHGAGWRAEAVETILFD